MHMNIMLVAHWFIFLRLFSLDTNVNLERILMLLTSPGLRGDHEPAKRALLLSVEWQRLGELTRDRVL